ncbi:hypothetical protein FACS1894202_12620 [Clostridia bacterium]|nr:hypothetical protein FACS1894202_12620 [Clostridia bacterium]
MNLNFKVLYMGEYLTMSKAIATGLIKIKGNQLEWNDAEVAIYESTELFDIDGNEIYDGDYLEDSKGTIFLVERSAGYFLVRDLNGSTAFNTIVINSLKFKNNVDTLRKCGQQKMSKK